MTSQGRVVQKDSIQKITVTANHATTARKLMRNLMLVMRQSYANWKGLERLQWLENGSWSTCFQRIFTKVPIFASHVLTQLMGQVWYWWWEMDTLPQYQAQSSVNQSRKQICSQENLIQREFMLSVWWDKNDQLWIYDNNKTINTDLYNQQLCPLSSFGRETSILSQQKKK